MTTRSCNPQIGPVGSEPERILWISRAATVASTPIVETDFAAQFTWARCVEVILRDILNVLSEQAVDDHVEDDPHYESIVEEEPMPENELSNESGYSGPTYDDVGRLIREALYEHDNQRLRPQ